MKNTERLELAQWAADYAKKCGADEVSIDINKSRSIQLECREKKLEKVQEATESTINITVYADNRFSSNSTSDFRKPELEKFIDTVVKMTKYLAKDEFRSLPDPKFYTLKEHPDLQVNDTKYHTIEPSSRVKIVKDLESAVLGLSDNIITSTTSYSDDYSESLKFNSNGFTGEQEETSFYVDASVTVKDEKTGGRPDGYDRSSVRFFDDLKNIPVIAHGAVRSALEKVGQQKLPTGNYDIIVENRVINTLINFLTGPLSGRGLQQKNSLFEGKIGSPVASDKLTIIDDPFVVRGLASRLYDGEGLAARRIPLIEKGVLKNFYINTYYGKKLKMEPTTGNSSNLSFAAGTKSLDELVKGMKKGFLIKGFIGGNSNPATGDFSLGVYGLYIENGAVVKPMNEMNLTANLLTFWGNLAEVGNDPEVNSRWRTPSMAFTGVALSGV
jgi:PmbA protein